MLQHPPLLHYLAPVLLVGLSTLVYLPPFSHRYVHLTPVHTYSDASVITSPGVCGYVFFFFFSFQQEDSLDNSFSTMTMSISGTNLYEAARLGGGSSVIESLQSQLKLREGEIAQLQVYLSLSGLTLCKMFLCLKMKVMH